MSPKSNRRIERHYFGLFREIYQLPKGEVIYGDKPDVIINGERRLGIEVTNFYLERGELIESEQNQRRIRDYVLKKAQQIYIDNGGKHEIYFSFNKENPILNSQKLIPKLLKVISKLEALGTGKFSKYFLNDIPELDLVIINPTIYTDPQWTINQVYTGQIISTPMLTEIVRKKENKAKNYSKCEAYWLIVVVDFFDPAQDQEIRVNGLTITSDVFEKKIVYKTAYEHVLEF